METMKVWILIPAYNEGNKLGRLLNELKQKKMPILVVDDGSTDNTWSCAKEYATTVIHNEINRGKGMSLKIGIEYLLKNIDFDYVITMDADGQHASGDIDMFLGEARKGAYLVIGNRMGNASSMPKIRLLTNKFMSWLISRMVKQRIPDTQCGYRLIKKEVLEGLEIKTNKFEVDSEIIITTAKKKFPITSIPVETIYSSDHHSKINPVIDTFRFIKFIFWR